MDYGVFCRDEYHDYLVYRELAYRERNPERREMLMRLAEQERRHYDFWRELTRDCRADVGRGRIALYMALKKVFGLVFLLRLLERHEKEVIARYRAAAERMDPEGRARLMEIIREEEEHETSLLDQIGSNVVRYVGFVVLGLADAIIEITGVHAGMLGVTNSTIMAGIAGIVVGFSAAISMASAAYLQAKHDGSLNPAKSAAVTGMAYILAVFALAVPYFVWPDMLHAFVASIVTALVLIGAFTFYSSVILDKGFTREFLEAVALLFGTVAGAYIIGDVLGRTFGIKIVE